MNSMGDLSQVARVGRAPPPPGRRAAAQGGQDPGVALAAWAPIWAPNAQRWPADPGARHLSWAQRWGAVSRWQPVAKNRHQGLRFRSARHAIGTHQQ